MLMTSDTGINLERGYGKEAQWNSISSHLETMKTMDQGKKMIASGKLLKTRGEGRRSPWRAPPNTHKMYCPPIHLLISADIVHMVWHNFYTRDIVFLSSLLTTFNDHWILLFNKWRGHLCWWWSTWSIVVTRTFLKVYLFDAGVLSNLICRLICQCRCYRLESINKHQSSPHRT